MTVRFKFARSSCICLSAGRVAKHHLKARRHDPNRSAAVAHDRERPTFCALCFLPAYARIHPLVVEAPVFVDARAVAFAEFHSTELRWEETAEEPEMVVSYYGNDYNKATGGEGKTRVVERR